MFLHEFAHVDADQRFFGIEQESRQRFTQLGFTDTGRAKEQERTIRTSRIAKPARERRIASDTATIASCWPTTRSCSIFHVQQLFALALHHARDRNAGRTRHDFRDFFGADLVRSNAFSQADLGFAFCGIGLLELRFQLRQRAVLQLRHGLPVAFARASPSAADALDLFLDVRTALHQAFSAFQISSRSAYSRDSFSISSSISARRLCEASSFSRLTASRSIFN
jgi:hypothetical protein